MIATNGRSGVSTAAPSIFTSFSTKKPNALGKIDAIPAVEACARCTLPNASSTNKSPKLAQYLANSGSFLLSPFS